MPASEDQADDAAVAEDTAGHQPRPAGGQGNNTAPADTAPSPEEIGGPAGPEPTRYGDWERKGRCIDF
jgi:hypothetical protein